MSAVYILHKAASDTIPAVRHCTRVKNDIHDDELKKKCRRSKVAWHRWRNAGCQIWASLPEYENLQV